MVIFFGHREAINATNEVFFWFILFWPEHVSMGQQSRPSGCVSILSISQGRCLLGLRSGMLIIPSSLLVLDKKRASLNIISAVDE